MVLSHTLCSAPSLVPIALLCTALRGVVCLLAVVASLGSLSLDVRAAESLETIYLLATEQDPVVRASVASAAAQRAAIGESRARLLPQLQLQALYTEVEQSGAVNGQQVDDLTDLSGTDYQIELQQSLFSLPNWQLWAASRAEGRRAEAALAAARESLVLRVADAYFGVLRASDNLVSARAETNTLREQSAKIERRFAAGLVLATEVLEARAAADLAEVNRLVHEDRLATALESLRVITGREHRELWRLRDDFSASGPQPDVLNTWLGWARQDNAELRAARHSLSAARRQFSAARSQLLPTLSGSVQYSSVERDGRSQALAIDQRYDGYTVALQLSLPLYTGGSLLAQRQRARQQYLQSRALLDSQRREVARQLRVQFSSARILERRVKAQQRSLDSVRQALASVRRGYESGTRDLIDVLGRETDLYAEQRNYSEARYDAILSLLQLKALAGRLSGADLQELNGWLVAPAAP